MKRSASGEKAIIPHKPVLEKADSTPLAVKKKTRKQLIDELIKTSCKVTGVRSDDVADRIIAQVGNALVSPRPKDVDECLVKAFAAIAGMVPKNATEAMLAAQMIAANDAALTFLRQATLETQYPEARDANVLRATRLMRLFSEQVEVMQKLKGRTSQQKVIVEHVHVNAGGQAVVGMVGGEGGGG